jgi:hypothetical protein
MNLNEIGISVKKNGSTMLGTILGIVAKSEMKQLKIHKSAKVVDNILIGKETKKALLDAEIQKSRAYKYVQNFQKY